MLGMPSPTQRQAAQSEADALARSRTQAGHNSRIATFVRLPLKPELGATI